MAVVFQNATITAHSADNISMDAPVPPGTTDGDFLVMAYSNNQASSDPAVTGWNLVDSVWDMTEDLILRVWWRRASSEPASYTITKNTAWGVESQAAILRYTGVEASGDPIGDMVTLLHPGRGGPFEAPALTTVNPTDLVLHLFGTAMGTWDGNDYVLESPDGVWNERVNAVDPDATASVGLVALDAIGETGVPAVTAEGVGAPFAAARILSMTLVAAEEVEPPQTGFAGWGIPI